MKCLNDSHMMFVKAAHEHFSKTELTTKELKEIPEEFIHKPWEMKDKVQNFEQGKNYPFPIVDHQAARESALKAKI